MHIMLVLIIIVVVVAITVVIITYNILIKLLQAIKCCIGVFLWCICGWVDMCALNKGHL